MPTDDNDMEDHGVDDGNQLLEKTNRSHMSLQCNHFLLSGGLEEDWRMNEFQTTVEN